MHPVSAIFLDLDDTLWDIEPVITRANETLSAFLQERCPRIGPITTREQWRQRFDDVIQANPHMQHDFTLVRREVLRQCVREADYPLAIADEAFDVFFRARNEVELYEDVVPSLKRLMRRYRLISVSNGNADLKAIGISSFFEFSIAARDVGALKPQPAVFRAALDRAQLLPDQVVHVGDDPGADIEGARGAGLHAVWLNRRGMPWPTSLRSPEFTVLSLQEFADRMGV